MSTRPKQRALLRSWRPLAALALVLAAAGAAVAVGTPTSSPLVWGGTVTDDAGKPYDKAVEVAVAFYDGQAATTPVCESKVVNAEAKTGRFSVVLPDACAKAVHDSPDLWSETVVGPSKTKLPRVKVAAVPYALEAAVAGVAGVAEKASGALAGEISGLSGKVSGVEGKLAKLEQDVAGLKSAGGSGPDASLGPGGPVLVDGNGVAWGTHHAFVYSSSSASVHDALVTPKGWVVWLKYKWSPSRFERFSSILYASLDCTGPGYIASPNVFWAESQMTAYSDGTSWKHFKQPAPGSALMPKVDVLVASYLLVDGTCKKADKPYAAKVNDVVPLTLSEVGLPSVNHPSELYWGKP
ncbi:MAG: hypothetical protein H6747_09455 [Deltaproteobacteria bacterium]|nr:hypothetical protein [Deltaproteobacteria bacterium]